MTDSNVTLSLMSSGSSDRLGSGIGHSSCKSSAFAAQSAAYSSVYGPLARVGRLQPFTRPSPGPLSFLWDPRPAAYEQKRTGPDLFFATGERLENGTPRAPGQSPTCPSVCPFRRFAASAKRLVVRTSTDRSPRAPFPPHRGRTSFAVDGLFPNRRLRRRFDVQPSV
jgi:hypothetical protein